MQLERIPPFIAIVLGLVSTLEIACTPCLSCLDGISSCGLTCPDEGITDGNTSISGFGQVDSFFAATWATTSEAATVRAEVEAQYRAIAASLERDPEASPGQINSELGAYLAESTKNGLRIRHAEPACSTSVEVATIAAARCDPAMVPGTLEGRCAGACPAESGVLFDCGALSELTCSGQAPDFECSGWCTGACELGDSGGTCAGVCHGFCDGECNVMDAGGLCEGECVGSCQGTCDLVVPDICEGSCHGTCEWTAASGGCETNEVATCLADAGATVSCDAHCRGQPVLEGVSAVCQETVAAFSAVQVQCNPPTVVSLWQWSDAAAADPQARAEFRAWLTGFEKRYAALLAADAKAQVLIGSGEELREAASGSVADASYQLVDGDTLRELIGGGCAIDELANVQDLLFDTVSDLILLREAIAAMFDGVVSS